SVEGSHVDLVQRLVIDEDIGRIRVIGDVVLDLRHHMLRLNAFDFCYAHLAGKKRIFAKRVVAAAKFEIAVDVDEWLERDIDAKSAVFAANHDAVVFSVFHTEGAATPMVAVSPCEGWRVSTP